MGRLHGVIHAAGLSGGETGLVERTHAQFESVLAPKLGGTQVLDEVLSDRVEDFVCYFSSSAAVLGDFGSCDYAIGNRYQSAYAGYCTSRPGGVRTLAIQHRAREECARWRFNGRYGVTAGWKPRRTRCICTLNQADSGR